MPEGGTQKKEWPGLAATLASYDDDRLVRLFGLRPDIITPAPRDWGALASRAGSWPSARDAYRELDRAAQHVVEALCLLDQPAPLADLAHLLDVVDDDPDLASALARLEDRALAFPTDHGVRLLPALKQVDYPAGLGPPLASILNRIGGPGVDQLALRLGLKPLRTKPETIALVELFLSGPADGGASHRDGAGGRRRPRSAGGRRRPAGQRAGRPLQRQRQDRSRVAGQPGPPRGHRLLPGRHAPGAGHRPPRWTGVPPRLPAPPGGEDGRGRLGRRGQFRGRTGHAGGGRRGRPPGTLVGGAARSPEGRRPRHPGGAQGGQGPRPVRARGGPAHRAGGGGRVDAGGHRRRRAPHQRPTTTGWRSNRRRAGGGWSPHGSTPRCT